MDTKQRNNSVDEKLRLSKTSRLEPNIQHNYQHTFSANPNELSSSNHYSFHWY